MIGLYGYGESLETDEFLYMLEAIGAGEILPAVRFLQSAANYAEVRLDPLSYELIGVDRKNSITATEIDQLDFYLFSNLSKYLREKRVKREKIRKDYRDQGFVVTHKKKERKKKKPEPVGHVGDVGKPEE